MKKIAYFLAVMFCFAAFSPAAMAAPVKKEKEKTELSPEEETRLAEINERVDEIKSMDFSEMSKDEIKDVRDELRGMKKEAKTMGEGIYLSVGAIIIILLVLILVT
ncbi:hypothetical protein DN752_11550 [Echinicola strongylocentroti]|uniref:Seryl-tRNA synthetase n=1 Tax=Echinicola strongylocentroti TaxID=1795355 RepID=A0A2Z4IQL1_9BACT|nr:hypothetical protein [Echinicola strongylocentroti]AWW33147.1 hypothetical protein DN752_11550 [Echinicola strongylocentroti]